LHLLCFEKLQKPFGFRNGVNTNHRPENVCDSMMNANQFIADFGNKNDDAERHHEEYDNGHKRYFVPFQHFPLKYRLGHLPMLPNVHEHQRIPRHTDDAMERPPRIVRRTGSFDGQKKSDEQQYINDCF
jgi:hypothetical protein